jgi:hypothetical protein
MKTLSAILAMLLLSGCSSMGKSILLGSAIGAGAGTGVGRLASRNVQGMVVGGLVGGAVGALFGFGIHKAEEGKKTSETSIPNDAKNSEVPALTNPEVRRIWQPDKIEGSKFIHGHFIDILEKGSQWAQ